MSLFSKAEGLVLLLQNKCEFSESSECSTFRVVEASKCAACVKTDTGIMYRYVTTKERVLSLVILKMSIAFRSDLAEVVWRMNPL